MRNIWLIAKREYLERIHAKSFLIMTILIPILMGGLLYGGAMVNSRIGSNHIAVVTDNPQFAEDLKTELSGKNRTAIVDVYSPTEPGVRDLLDQRMQKRSIGLGGYLWVTPPVAGESRGTYEWDPKAKADIVTKSRVADAVRGVLARETLAQKGMSATEVNDLLKPVELKPPPKDRKNSDAAFASAYGLFFLMYFVILFYGMNVARSIIEEKTSRVFEVMLSKVRPAEMMAGKVIGVGSVGLTQVGIWIIVALAGFKIQGLGSDLNDALPTPGQLVCFVIFFTLGYVLYSSIAAALGAMTNSEQELQQMNMFLMLPLIACSVVIFRVVTDPDGPISVFMSFVPFCTPLIMYTRIIVHQPPIWQIALSIVLLVATIYAVLWIASRIYRVGVLMYGKKPNLPEILRWLKYS